MSAIKQEVAVEATTKQEWSPPPGVTADVLYGSPEGPVMVARVRLAPRAEVPGEVHEMQIERVSLAAGALQISICGEWRPVLCCGDTCTILPGLPHIIANPSTFQPAEYIAVMTRVGHDGQQGGK